MILKSIGRFVATALIVASECVTSLDAPLPLRADEPATNAATTVGPWPRTTPVSPADAPATIRAQHGFRLELLAAEPLVMDPVAIDYDEEGRAWVVEMSDYPYTDKTTDKPFVERTTDLPLGRVRILEDRDGDGRFDESFLFADQLSWPTGLAFWKGGVFVLRRAQAVEDTLPRERIDSLVGVGKSLMPEGLEQKLNVQDMADLLAYLRTGGSGL